MYMPNNQLRDLVAILSALTPAKWQVKAYNRDFLMYD
jgi:hypothetical protein